MGRAGRAVSAMVQTASLAELRWMIDTKGTSPSLRVQCSEEIARREAAAWTPDEELVADMRGQLDAALRERVLAALGGTP